MTPLRLATMLPPAQHIAATSTSHRPRTLVSPSVWSAMTTMPLAASSSAAHWKPRTFSPVSKMASPIVKKTWHWMTSEASPGEMCPAWP